MKFTVERNGQTIEKSVTPQQVEDSTVYAAMPSLKSTNKAIGKKTYRLGFEYLRERKRTDVVQTIKYAAYEVKFWIFTTVESLGSLIKGSVSPKEISGPVGIVSIIKTGGEQSESYGFASLITYLLNISILITANLGVMNLLPIPALDGGRLLFLIIEWIRRKPLNQKFENGVNFVGFALLMLLMVVILFNDILKLI